MKKGLVVIALGIISLFVGVKSASANEGIVKLRPNVGWDTNCFVASIYMDGNYNLLGSCREVLVPVNAEVSRYFLWAVDEKNNAKRLGEVIRGKIEDSTNDKFSKLILTAEETTNPKKPSDRQVAMGAIEALPFDGAVNVTPTPSVAQVSVAPTKAPGTNQPNVPNSSSVVGRFLGIVGRVFLVFVVVLLIVVIAMTFITRRKDKI